MLLRELEKTGLGNFEELVHWGAEDVVRII